jgi:DNA polymerase elongation subunit (family B)
MVVYDVPTLVEKFIEKPYMLIMGKGKLAQRFNVTKGEIVRARDIVKRMKLPLTTEVPKVLLLDIETAFMRAYVFSRWKQNIHLPQTISEWFMLSWSAKWLYSTEVMSDVLDPIEVKEEDDERIAKSLWKLMDEADIVIAHNGDYFDLPKINSRFILNELPPPSPYRTIDTLKVAQRTFGFSSNKLDALAQYFGIDVKMDTGMSLWVRCMKGEEDALKYMEEYNKKDVVILEEVYLKLRPWIKGHPNMGIYMEEDKTLCSACAGSNIYVIPDKFYFTQTTKYPVYRCMDCSALTRGRKTVLDKEVVKTLGTSIPR